MPLADLRKDYSLSGLAEKDLARDPFRQFQKWFQEAEAAKVIEPNAMVVSTVSKSGQPSSRVILLKGVDGRGFVFYTNYESRKGREIEANPRVSLLFPWLALERQVVVEGSVTKISREESEAYFHSRPVIEDAAKALEKKYAGQQVPIPPHWGGYRVSPESVEFWQGRRSRLHDRLRYRREKDAWIVERLSP